jgi:THAP domain/Zinc-finger associated domain (zf-AD)
MVNAASLNAASGFVYKPIREKFILVVRFHFDENNALRDRLDELIMTGSWGGQSCVVIGCRRKPYTYEKGLHHYNFPSDPILRDVWITFSRRGSDFQIKKSTVVCEKHFEKSCFKKRKKQLRLVTGSVPTIFYRETSTGSIEKVQVHFDSSVMHYSEVDMELLKPAYDKDDHENKLLEKRKKRLRRIGRLCRFCLDEQNESKLVDIKKLNEYATSIEEVYKLMSIDTMKEKYWSDFACEECFQQIISFDGFRKRCTKVQRDFTNELKELDKRIINLQRGMGSEEFPVKIEIDCNPDPETEDEFNAHENLSGCTIVIEPILKTDVIDNIKIEPNSEKSENRYDFSVPDFLNESNSADSSFKEDQNFSLKNEELSVEKLKDEPTVIPKNVSKSESKEVNKVRIYECFFCELVSFPLQHSPF